MIDRKKVLCGCRVGIIYGSLRPLAQKENRSCKPTPSGISRLFLKLLAFLYGQLHSFSCYYLRI